MHARPRILSAWIVMLAVAVSVLVAGGGSASAAQAPLAASQACQKPASRNDQTIHIQGCLSDARKKPPKPVSGVKIDVEDEAGKVVGKGVSNASGVFDVRLPGASIDNLG